MKNNFDDSLIKTDITGNNKQKSNYDKDETANTSKAAKTKDEITIKSLKNTNRYLAYAFGLLFLIIGFLSVINIALNIYYIDKMRSMNTMRGLAIDDAILSAAMNGTQSSLVIFIITMLLFLLLVYIIMRLVFKSNHTTRAIVSAYCDAQTSVTEDEYELHSQDVTTMEQRIEQLIHLQERYSNYLDAANDLIFEIDTETGESFFSNKWTNITTFPPVKKLSWGWVREHVEKEDVPALQRILDNKACNFYEQFRIQAEDGQERWLAIKGKWIQEANQLYRRITGSITNITQQKKSEAYLEFIAYHDSLTLLPNRSHFMNILEETIQDALKNNVEGAMFFIDLDNFKVINDMYGHTFGDRLLIEVSERLRMLSDMEDIVARFGGDEFMVLIKEFPENDYEYIEARLDSIINSFSEPIVLDAQSFFVTASVGVSIFPKDGENMTEIIKNSDSAMYESKGRGRNTYAFYHKVISEKIIRKNQISEILRTAIAEEKVFMEFQPQFDVQTSRIEGFEALMRLKDNNMGSISPVEFIPIAEESGIIVTLGYWAIRQAILCDKRLQAEGLQYQWIAVNVSEIQLRERDFLERLQEILDETKSDPQRLHIEITEGILLSDIEKKSGMFERMKEMGIKIELDDFGTGYSSLNYIRAIPLDTIKIDKCFINEIGKSPEKEALIELIINLAKEYGMSTVSEGVETQEQVAFLKDRGAKYLQGFYYSKPLGSGEIIKKVNRINSQFQIEEK